DAGQIDIKLPGEQERPDGNGRRPRSGEEGRFLRHAETRALKRCGSGPARAVRRYGEVERQMAFRRTEAQKGLAQGGEDRHCNAAKGGAEVLRLAEPARAFQAVAAAVNLARVMAGAERITRKLGRYRLSRFGPTLH